MKTTKAPKARRGEERHYGRKTMGWLASIVCELTSSPRWLDETAYPLLLVSLRERAGIE